MNCNAGNVLFHNKMGKVILVASGKGGVGKSSLCVSIGWELAKRSAKTIIIDLDFGLRSLDLMIGLDTVPVYNLADILNEKCEPGKAIITPDEDLMFDFISAPMDVDETINYSNFKPLIELLKKHYEFVIFDCGAGISKSFKEAISISDEGIIITTPDAVSARGGAIIADIFRANNLFSSRLIINKAYLSTKQNPITDFDQILDMIGMRLLGVVPNDFNLPKVTATGGLININGDNIYSLSVKNICGRILGENIPLLIN